MSAAVHFLRAKTNTISSKLRDFFAVALSNVPEDAVKQRKDEAVKNEDQIVFDLKALVKLLRGAADVLGDGLTGGSVADESDTHLPDDDRSIVSTARELVVNSLPAEEKEFLANYRQNMLELLVFVSDSLDQVAAATTPAAKSYAGLANNALVRSAWIKLLQAIITRRSACKKHTLKLLYIYLFCFIDFIVFSSRSCEESGPRHSLLIDEQAHGSRQSVARTQHRAEGAGIGRPATLRFSPLAVSGSGRIASGSAGLTRLLEVSRHQLK